MAKQKHLTQGCASKRCMRLYFDGISQGQVSKYANGMLTFHTVALTGGKYVCKCLDPWIKSGYMSNHPNIIRLFIDH
jgi:hypothetical protein